MDNFEKGETIVSGGIKGWNREMERCNETSIRSEQLSIKISTLSDLIWRIGCVCKVKEINGDITKMMSLLNRHKDITNRMNLICSDDQKGLELTAKVLAEFLPRYYNIETHISKIKTDIAKCLLAAAKLVSVARNTPSNNERNEINELRGQKNQIRQEINNLENTVNVLTQKKSTLEKDIQDLKVKYKELEEKCKEIE